LAIASGITLLAHFVAMRLPIFDVVVGALGLAQMVLVGVAVVLVVLGWPTSQRPEGKPAVMLAGVLYMGMFAMSQFAYATQRYWLAAAWDMEGVVIGFVLLVIGVIGQTQRPPGPVAIVEAPKVDRSVGALVPFVLLSLAVACTVSLFLTLSYEESQDVGGLGGLVVGLGFLMIVVPTLVLGLTLVGIGHAIGLRLGVRSRVIGAFVGYMALAVTFTVAALDWSDGDILHGPGGLFFVLPVVPGLLAALAFRQQHAMAVFPKDGPNP
jgi:hypothetical protein